MSNLQEQNQEMTKVIKRYKSKTIGGAVVIVLISTGIFSILAGIFLYFFGVDFNIHSDMTVLDKFVTGFFKGIIGPIRSLFGISELEGSSNAIAIVIPIVIIGFIIGIIVAFLVAKKELGKYKILTELSQHFPDKHKIENVGKMLLEETSDRVKGACAAILSFGDHLAIEYLSKSLNIFHCYQFDIAKESINSLVKIGGNDSLNVLKEILKNQNTIKSRLLQELEDDGRKESVKIDFKNFINEVKACIERIQTNI